MWQREMSVSYDKVGDAQLAQGDFVGALKSYSDSLAILERLAKTDPGNAEWQSDLSVAYSKIGDVQVAQGDLAVTYVRIGVDVRTRQFALPPAIAGIGLRQPFGNGDVLAVGF